MRAPSGGGWRTQEALTVAGAVSLVEQVNALGGGPHTGKRPAFVMTTGDNTDNNSAIELEWFLTAMSGGLITPNTGDPAAYEGVQNSGLPLFWHPDDALLDLDKRRGLPRIPGYLEAAIRPLTSPGLNIPWYSTPGNHDELPGGCLAPADPELSAIITGSRKLISVPESELAAFANAIRTGDDPKSEALNLRLNPDKIVSCRGSSFSCQQARPPATLRSAEATKVGGWPWGRLCQGCALWSREKPKHGDA
jgi:metallophosphoesterase (TIGR03767 family)